jgi:hypothetical protein
MNSTVEYFDFYTSIGWEVVPLMPGRKLPIFKGWNKEYDSASARDMVVNGKCNIGLRLGNIVDLEADDEHANAYLHNLASSTNHPKYQSSKSVHHLFLSPWPNLTRVVIRGIEFRGGLHQSALPPSVVDGVEYKWIDAAGFDLPQVPESIINIYNSYYARLYAPARNNRWVEPWCSICKNQSRPIHKKRYNLELLAFDKMGDKWQCHKCRKIDLRKECRRIKLLS